MLKIGGRLRLSIPAAMQQWRGYRPDNLIQTQRLWVEIEN